MDFLFRNLQTNSSGAQGSPYTKPADLARLQIWLRWLNCECCSSQLFLLRGSRSQFSLKEKERLSLTSVRIKSNPWKGSKMKVSE